MRYPSYQINLKPTEVSVICLNLKHSINSILSATKILACSQYGKDLDKMIMDIELEASKISLLKSPLDDMDYVLNQ
jgi:hypothetical protein